MANLHGTLSKFTGEVDIDLTKLGEQEAMLAGVLLEDYIIDLAYTSVLKRAIHTLAIILNELGKNIPVVRSAALNERNYGDLQGLNKQETAYKYGADKVLLWRRSYETPGIPRVYEFSSKLKLETASYQDE